MLLVIDNFIINNKIQFLSISKFIGFQETVEKFRATYNILIFVLTHYHIL